MQIKQAALFSPRSTVRPAAIMAALALLLSLSLPGELAGQGDLAGQVLAETPTTKPSVAKVRPGPFDKAFIVPIQNEITDITLGSIQRRLDRARAEQVKLVILELDTPGGALGATLEICDEIKKARSQGITVYAWVNNTAYSAGTIIALATDGIIMAPNATMGDSQPIMITGEGAAAIPEELQAKHFSPLLEELRDSAFRNGYDLDLVMSLVRPEIQVFWLVNKDTSQRDFVDEAGRNRLFGLDAEALKLAGEFVPDSASTTAWHYVLEDPLLGEVQQPVVTNKELLTMRDNRARAYGLSEATVTTEAEIKTLFQVTGLIERTELTWMERIVGWLASPLVRGVLFMLVLLGVYAEFHAPGVGLPGAIALAALVLFLGAPYVAGFTVTWEIAVIIVGLVLLGIELFVIPGFGVVGIAGLILLGFGLLSSFAPPEPFRRHWFDLPNMPQTYDYIRNGTLAMAGGTGMAMVFMAILSRYLPRAPIMNRLIGRNPTREEVTVEDPYHGIAKVGDIGRTDTLLRPAGKARFGAVLVDVVSQGEYVPAGERVEVVERYGNRVVVRKMA
jgi:membrane-bound serine protease (ClpP class)